MTAILALLQQLRKGKSKKSQHFYSLAKADRFSSTVPFLITKTRIHLSQFWSDLSYHFLFKIYFLRTVVNFCRNAKSLLRYCSHLRFCKNILLCIANKIQKYILTALTNNFLGVTIRIRFQPKFGSRSI